MTDLLAARSQMALSLGFHILFSVVGIAMPLLMVIAEWRYLKTGREVFKTLARRWSKGVAILFGVGAVSGTVLSFELGLLWPEFMAWAGPVIGMPFSLEGFAFFLEAIFLGIYLYGWDRVPPKAHLAAGLGVAISGTMSGIFVVSANAWMNTPQGFELGPDGQVLAVNVWEAMFNPAMPTQTLHMTIAAFEAVGFLVAGIHALRLLRDPDNDFHRQALAIALIVGGVAAFLQPLSGDLAAKHLAEHQPVKLAAMEGHWETESGASLLVGGLPDEETETTPYAIHIPKALSFLAYADFDAEVKGLKEFPVEDRPPVTITHLSFQAMVGIGTWLMALGALGALLWWRAGKQLPRQRWFLGLLAASTPLGMLAVEAGWMVTEIGRQPWVIHGIMRTKDAVTPMPNLVGPMTTFALLYLVLGVVVVLLMKRHVFDAPRVEPGEPAGPGERSEEVSHVA